MKFFDGIADQPWFILIIVLGFFVLLILVTILLRKFVLNKNKKEKKVSEAEARLEHMNSMLEDVTDEETLKDMKKYDK